MKIPDRFPPTVNTVTTKMTQRTRTYRDHWGAAEWIWTLSLYLSETKVWFLRRGHSRMEKKAGPNQVNRMLLSHNKRIILTLWPHQLWRMSFYSQSVISKDSLTLFNPQPRHHRYFSPQGQLLHLQNRIWALQLVAYIFFNTSRQSIRNQEGNMQKHLSTCVKMTQHAHVVYTHIELSLSQFPLSNWNPISLYCVKLAKTHSHTQHSCTHINIHVRRCPTFPSKWLLEKFCSLCDHTKLKALADSELQVLKANATQS